METPKNDAGKLTEIVMAAVAPHLKIALQGYHPYNRCYEAVYKALVEHQIELVKRG